MDKCLILVLTKVVSKLVDKDAVICNTHNLSTLLSRPLHNLVDIFFSVYINSRARAEAYWVEHAKHWCNSASAL